MREHKYRVWDKAKKYFIYFDFNQRWFDDDNDTVTFNCTEVIGDHETNNDRFEFQEYTGLHDRHGVEIYEGDIVRYNYPDGSGNKPKEVFWDDRDLKWTATDSITGMATHRQVVEVIGNIYENSDLLKEAA